MKIVIDIPEETVKEIKDNAMFAKPIADHIKWDITSAIVNGIPLPEHHGLIDRLELSDHIKNRLIQTAMNNMETILPYSKVCTDIVDNRIDIWIDEVKTIIEGSESE